MGSNEWDSAFWEILSVFWALSILGGYFLGYRVGQKYGFDDELKRRSKIAEDWKRAR